MSQMLHVLVVDDEADIRYLLTDILKEQGFSVAAVANSTAAFKSIEEKLPSVIILDIWLQNSDLDGLSILEIVKKRYPLLPVIVISGHGTIKIAVDSIKLGAYYYLEKPFTQDELMTILKRACEAAKLKRENLELKSKVIDKTELVGNSPAIIKLKHDIERVAPTAGRVMIHGEIGTGKELAARLIHKKSKRLQGHFIVFNPSCMSTERVMHELFGDEEGGGAKKPVIAQRISILEAANNGTLYIDEVGDLPMVAQIRLLKFLQDQILEKPSLGKSIKLDVRMITASIKDLQNEVNHNRFRQDLYYRLNVIPIKIPNLAERKEDIPLLVTYFVKQIAKFSGLKEREFSYEAIAALQTYYWPGNVRQLRNIIEWTLIMNPIHSSNNEIIKPSMLPPEILNNNVMISKPETNLDMISMTLKEAREEFEKQYLSLQIRRFNNNISRTSSFVGMERSALHRKLKMLDIYNPTTGSPSKILSEET